MREIKFRYVLKVYNTSRDDPAYYEWRELKVFTLGELENNELNEWIIKEFYGIIETVAKDQYTGLKDKNGKEIYEGDIVRTCQQKERKKIDDPFAIIEVVGVVKYESPAFFLQLDSGFPKNWVDLESSAEPYEIIGNIYEKGKK